jgi:HTTM domain
MQLGRFTHQLEPRPPARRIGKVLGLIGFGVLVASIGADPAGVGTNAGFGPTQWVLAVAGGLTFAAGAALSCRPQLVQSAVMRRVVQVLSEFFLAKEGPFNLAVTRIWFFAVLPFVLPSLGQVEQMAALPTSLQFPPRLLGWVVADLGLTPAVIRVLWAVIVVGCILAALGLVTRTAALAVTLAAFLYVGEWQLFGKVNHNHHLLWIAAVFVVAPSTDALSLKTVIRGGRGLLPVASVPPSRAYALPLRAIWLLIGLVYLFPGFYKAVLLNVRWFDPATLQHILWWKWAQLEGYRPFFRVDEYPPLLLLMAAATLVFELGFIFLLLTRTTRHLVAALGLLFQSATSVLMQIPFRSLKAIYPLLVDWEWVSRRILKRRRELLFFYDGQCGICKPTVSILQRWVTPGSVTFVDANNEAALDAFAVPGQLRDELLVDLHVWDGSRTWTGYPA